MKWNNVKPDIFAQDLMQVFSDCTALDLVQIIGISTEIPFVVFPDRVRSKVLAHLESKRVEMGGLLVGSVVSYNDLETGLVMVIIKDSIPSNDFDSTSVSLSMSPSVWQSANQLCDRNTFVVGWYHSHPNLGAFFSGVDRKTQKNFFSSSYNLGLVIDNVRNEEKWFLGPDSVEISPNHIRSEFDGLAMV